jgi:hypothetical protein
MSLVVRIAWEREEEGRSIETVLFAELRKLFGRGLFAENGDSRIARHEFDQ